MFGCAGNTKTGIERIVIVAKFIGVDLPNPRALRYLVAAHRRGEIGWPAFGVGVALACYIRRGDHELVRTADLATLSGLAGLAHIPLAAIPGVLKELEDAGFLAWGEDNGRPAIFISVTPWNEGDLEAGRRDDGRAKGSGRNGA